MTDDYLAISNTGKNITITMTPGMKQCILGDNDRVWLRFGQASGSAILSRDAIGRGYKILRRKTVWNMSVASARFKRWPKHERIVVPMSGVQMHNLGAIVPLPKTSLEEEVINAGGANILRDAEAVIDGEVFHLKLDERDGERIKAAWKRREKKLYGASWFSGLDMVVAAITGACGGFMIAVLLAAAGVLK